MSNKNLNAVITIGGTVSQTLRNSIFGTTKSISEMGSAVRKMEKDQRALGKEIGSMASAGRGLGVLPQRYDSMGSAIEKLKSKHLGLLAVQDRMNTSLGKLKSGLIGFTAVAAAAATVFIPIVSAAADFEKHMLGVAKQVPGARDGMGRLTGVYRDMKNEVREMSRILPLTTNQIADMYTAGARMSVPTEQLRGFVETAARMSVSFEVEPSELADKMGKIANIYGIPIPKIERLGDVINYLDDNAISKGSDIIEVLSRVSGTTKTVGMSSNDAAALGSTFLSLGSTAEIAATATNAVIRELAIATAQPKRFQEGLKAVGMSAKDVQRGMATDATGTIQKVLDALNKLPQEKRLEIATQLFGKEYSDDVSKLAVGVEEYRRQLRLANSEEAKGSMAREFAAQMDTFNAKFALAKNVVKDLAVGIGIALIPGLNSVLDTVTPIISKIGDFIESHSELISGIVLGGSAFVGTILTLKGLSLGIVGVTWAFNALKLAAMTNPFTLGIAGLIAFGVLLYKYRSEIADWAKSSYTNITEWFGKTFGFLFTGFDRVGEAWRKAKGWVGLSTPAASPGVPNAGPALPRPAMAGARGPATQNNTYTVNVQAAPGQSPHAVAQATGMEILRVDRNRPSLGGKLDLGLTY